MGRLQYNQVGHHLQDGPYSLTIKSKNMIIEKYTLQQYLIALIRVFTKRKNFTGLALLVIAGSVTGAPVTNPANITNSYAYATKAGTVASTVSKATVKAAVQPPKKKKEIVKPLLAFLQHCRNAWGYDAGTFEYQHSGQFTCSLAGIDRSVGELWRIPVLEMSNSNASAEKLSNFRRYQFSIGEFFLIPRRYQFQIEEFFLIPWWYQFLIEDFFLIPPLLTPVRAP